MQKRVKRWVYYCPDVIRCVGRIFCFSKLIRVLARKLIAWQKPDNSFRINCIFTIE